MKVLKIIGFELLWVIMAGVGFSVVYTFSRGNLLIPVTLAIVIIVEMNVLMYVMFRDGEE